MKSELTNVFFFRALETRMRAVDQKWKREEIKDNSLQLNYIFNLANERLTGLFPEFCFLHLVIFITRDHYH